MDWTGGTRDASLGTGVGMRKAQAMVVVYGEALVDLLVDLGSDSGASPAAMPVPGGCGLNLAIGLARLHCPTRFIGGLSRDAFGQFLARRLDDEGVVLSASVASDRPTRLVTVTRGPAGEPEYGFYGVETADLAPPGPQDSDSGARILAFCSYPSLFAPGLAACLARAQACPHLLISFDPNIRLTLNPDATGWRQGCEAMMGACHIVKASMADLRALWGEDCDAQSWAGHLLAAAPQRRPLMIVLTDGARGASVFTARGMIEAPAPRVDVVDTVGAGDAFHAAFLAGLTTWGLDAADALAGCDLQNLQPVLARAVLAGALTCTRPGADPPDLARLTTGIS